MTREGCLLAIGGNEDKESRKDVLRFLVGLPDGGAKRILVIPTASLVAEEVADSYREAFGDLGVAVDVLDVRDRQDADRPEAARRIAEADVVFLTGGDQLRLTSLVGGTAVEAAMHELLRRGGVVAGTSAGAACLGDTMIVDGAAGGMRRGNVHMTPGLAFVKGCILDTHFLDRGRLNRLLEVVAANPGCIGLGIGEDTALLIRGTRVECVGRGLVVVVDGHDVRHTNISQVEPEEPVALENATLHTMSEGYAFDLATRKYHPASPEQGKASSDRRREERRRHEAQVAEERREIAQRDREAEQREREAQARRRRDP